MVYTQARLDHALRVFRDVSVWRNRRGLPSEHLERQLRTGYALRKTAQSVPLVNVTWRDKDSSDDEEYDPFTERKAACRKKKVERKRKADDISDGEKIVKKIKGSHDTFSAQVADASCVVLKLNSEHGRALLKSIGIIRSRVEIDPEAESSGEEDTPSYFSRYASSRKKKKKPENAWNTLELAREWVGSDLENVLSGTGRRLRNGKTLQQKKKEEEKRKKTNKRDVSSNNKTSDSSTTAQTGQSSLPNKSNNQNLRSIHRVTKPVIKNDRMGGSIHNPINLDDDSDEHAQQTSVKETLTIADSQYNCHPQVKQEYPLSPISLQDEPSSRAVQPDVPDYNSEQGILVIETSYAHPIDFRYNPNPATGLPCDFCADFRMAILGLAKRTVEVFIDPDHPYQYQEIGDGHRSEGRDNTRMCIKCALGRLLMMRCHDSRDVDEMSTLEKQAQRPASNFRRIRGLVIDGNKMNAYIPHLFQKTVKDAGGTEDEGIGDGDGNGGVSLKIPFLPTCNLCYAPATFECCRWQKTDMMKRARQVPGSHTMSDGSMSAKLLPAKAGCGLKLCGNCRLFVDQECQGKLDKRKVMKWLHAGRGKGNSFGPRADVEWLFKGSMLDQCYAAGGQDRRRS